MSSLRLLSPIVVLVALILPAVAEERQTQSPGEQAPATTTETAPAAPSPTMRDLLNEGYEVKSVSIVPHDVVKRGGSTTDVDATIIVLQKGPTVATCYEVFTSLTDGSLVSLPCNVYK
jgi:hypothetical protein